MYVVKCVLTTSNSLFVCTVLWSSRIIGGAEKKTGFRHAMTSIKCDGLHTLRLAKKRAMCLCLSISVWIKYIFGPSGRATSSTGQLLTRIYRKWRVCVICEVSNFSFWTRCYFFITKIIVHQAKLMQIVTSTLSGPIVMKPYQFVLLVIGYKRRNLNRKTCMDFRDMTVAKPRETRFS